MPLGHRAERPHAPVGLVGAALVQLDFAGRLFRAGKQAADHGAVGAGGDRLGEIAGIADAAVGDQRHAGALERRGHVSHGRDLRHAHAGHDARGADRARADADLDAVRAGRDQGLGGLPA